MRDKTVHTSNPEAACSRSSRLLRPARPPAIGIAGAIVVALLAASLVSGCGYKTALELPKKAQPAKPAP